MALTSATPAIKHLAKRIHHASSFYIETKMCPAPLCHSFIRGKLCNHGLQVIYSVLDLWVSTNSPIFASGRRVADPSTDSISTIASFHPPRTLVLREQRYIPTVPLWLTTLSTVVRVYFLMARAITPLSVRIYSEAALARSLPVPQIFPSFSSRLSLSFNCVLCTSFP